MFLAAPAPGLSVVPAALARAGVRQPRHLARGGLGGGDQPPARPAHRCADGAHLASAAAHRLAQLRARCWSSRSRSARCRWLLLVVVRQRAVRGADLRLADRLRDRLHRLAQARDAAEHRHRRRRRRGAARAGLGRGDHAPLAVRAAAVPDHLRLDAAAFLGAGDLPPRGLRQGHDPDAAGDPWRGVHALADPVLHRAAGAGDAAAVHRRHERRVLPGRRAGARRRCSCTTRSGC